MPWRNLQRMIIMTKTNEELVNEGVAQVFKAIFKKLEEVTENKDNDGQKVE